MRDAPGDSWPAAATGREAVCVPECGSGTADLGPQEPLPTCPHWELSRFPISVPPTPPMLDCFPRDDRSPPPTLSGLMCVHRCAFEYVVVCTERAWSFVASRSHVWPRMPYPLAHFRKPPTNQPLHHPKLPGLCPQRCPPGQGESCWPQHQVCPPLEGDAFSSSLSQTQAVFSGLCPIPLSSGPEGPSRAPSAQRDASRGRAQCLLEKEGSVAHGLCPPSLPLAWDKDVRLHGQ